MCINKGVFFIYVSRSFLPAIQHCQHFALTVKVFIEREKFAF